MDTSHTTLTIRMRRDLRERLRKGAQRSGKRDSELAREFIERGLDIRTLFERSGHLKGQLTQPERSPDTFSNRIRENNWRV